eukprot:32773-Pelagomonas_calceolata.AAC.1
MHMQVRKGLKACNFHAAYYYWRSSLAISHLSSRRDDSGSASLEEKLITTNGTIETAQPTLSRS